MEYNSHFVRANADGNIIHGFSDAFEQPQDGDVLINERGGRQFDIDDETNPRLLDESGVPLFRLEGNEAVKRTQREMDASRLAAHKSQHERIRELDAKITEELPQVVAKLYDIVMQPDTQDAAVRKGSEAITDGDSLAGIEQWRLHVSEREKLAETSRKEA